MIIWHRRGCHGTTPRHRSRNIANSTFSEGWLQETLRICRFADSASHPPCKKHCKYNAFMQNAAKRRFWDHTMGGGGGGVVANREPGSYISIIYERIDTMYAAVYKYRYVCTHTHHVYKFASSTIMCRSTRYKWYCLGNEWVPDPHSHPLLYTEISTRT